MKSIFLGKNSRNKEELKEEGLRNWKGKNSVEIRKNWKPSLCNQSTRSFSRNKEELKVRTITSLRN